MNRIRDMVGWRAWSVLLAATTVISFGFVPSARGAEVYDFDNLPSIDDRQFSSVGISAATGMRTSGNGRGQSHAFEISGNDDSPSDSSVYFEVFDVNILVRADTVLSYEVAPLAGLGTFVAVDLVLDDGSGTNAFRLRGSGASDQYGVAIDPVAQGQGGHLQPGMYNQIESAIGQRPELIGKSIKQILVGYEEGSQTGAFDAVVDNIVLVTPPSKTVWITGRIVDQNDQLFDDDGALLDPVGNRSTCGTSQTDQGSPTCGGSASAINPYVARAKMYSKGYVRMKAIIPAGRELLVSVCGGAGAYECTDHPPSSYCRPAQDVDTTLKLWLLVNPGNKGRGSVVPAFIDVWWKYVPAGDPLLTGAPSCDENGYPNQVPAATLGASGDIDANGFLTLSDAVRTLRCAARRRYCRAGDVDGNGLLTVADGVAIGRLAAGLPIPEPYTVKPIYFVPQSRAAAPAYKEKIQTAMLMIQQFYRERMAANGVPDRPFNMALGSGGKPEVYFVRGAREATDYQALAASNGLTAEGFIGPEIGARVDLERSVPVVIADVEVYNAALHANVGPFSATEGGGLRGGIGYASSLPHYLAGTIADETALLCDPTPDPLGDGNSIGHNASLLFGGFAHEFGHGLGAAHEGSATDLMGTGFGTFGAYFNQCDPADPIPTLSAGLTLLFTDSPFFRSVLSYPDTTPPNLTLTGLPSSATRGQQVTMTITVSDAESGPKVLNVTFRGVTIAWEDLTGRPQPVTVSITHTIPADLPPDLDGFGLKYQARVFDGDANFGAVAVVVTLSP